MNKTEHKICEPNIKFNEKIFNKYAKKCGNKCVKDCNEVYYSLRFDNSLVLNISQTKVSLKYQNLLEFHYTSKEKYTVFDYLSNIGGLIGLWIVQII